MSSLPHKTKLHPAATFSLTALVDYSEGAVVSRTILKNEAGTVTLFSFDEGQALSEHSTPFDALVQVLDGAVELTIGGKKIAAKTGEIVILPANIPHAVKAVKKFKMLLTMIKG
jgi:quercetin dioxygenase-like cupin family protein